MGDGYYPARSYPKEDPDNPRSMFERQMGKSYHVKEYAIAIEEIKIMQQQLRECYIKEVRAGGGGEGGCTRAEERVSAARTLLCSACGRVRTSRILGAPLA